MEKIHSITHAPQVVFISLILTLVICCNASTIYSASDKTVNSANDRSVVEKDALPQLSDLKLTTRDTLPIDTIILPKVNIVTLGQADHGKTTLTAAITKVFAKEGYEAVSYESIDKAPAEKSLGMEFNISYVEYETANRHYVHTDCPSHVDYVKNLITGAIQADGAILVVAATDGPMPQTREHVLLAQKIGIPRLVVFMSKLDLVDDEEHLDLVEKEIRELLIQHEFDGDKTPIIRGSALGALEGNPKWEAKIQELMAAVDDYIPSPRKDVDKDFLMPVEDVFSITNRGTVATGRIERGMVNTGDYVEIIGLMKEGEESLISIVSGVEQFRKINDQGKAGENVGLLLRGIDKKQIRRGMVIAKRGSINAHTKFKAEVYMLSKYEGGRHTPFFENYRPQFYFRTTDVTGTISLPEGVEMVLPGDNLTINVDLINPIALEKGLRFAIREGGRTIGAGQVTELLEDN